jgi:hypothetical protein
MALPNFANYVLPFWFSRWVSLAAGVYLMILSGSFYLFSVYSSTINVIFGYTTAQTNLVGTLGNVGLSFPSLAPCLFVCLILTRRCLQAVCAVCWAACG